MANELGAALRGGVEDRRDDSWQWWMPPDKPLAAELPQTLTQDELVDRVVARVRQGQVPTEPPSEMAIGMGAKDIRPLTKEEMLQHILFIEGHNPDPQGRVPLPRPRPIPRR